MEHRKINLSVDDIADKAFKKSPVSGYNKQEVDDFLNIIIDDYENYLEIIDHLKKKNTEFKETNIKLNNRLNELLIENNHPKLDQNSNEATNKNLSIAQRLSNLERDYYEFKAAIVKAKRK